MKRIPAGKRPDLHFYTLTHRYNCDLRWVGRDKIRVIERLLLAPCSSLACLLLTSFDLFAYFAQLVF